MYRQPSLIKSYIFFQFVPATCAWQIQEFILSMLWEHMPSGGFCDKHIPSNLGSTCHLVVWVRDMYSLKPSHRSHLVGFLRVIYPRTLWDNTCRFERYTHTLKPEQCAQPEGLIDVKPSHIRVKSAPKYCLDIFSIPHGCCLCLIRPINRMNRQTDTKISQRKTPA